MDPLSDVLSLLKPQSHTYGGFDVGGDFAVQFPAYEGIKCYAVVSGQRWLAVEGVGEPVHLTAGDCFLLPRGRPFRLASDLTLPPADAPTLQALKRRNGSLVTINGGGDCLTVGGHFTLGGDHAGNLLSLLPPIVHIRKESDRAAIRWSLDRMMLELRDPQPGGHLVAQNLACLILVQALRLYLEDGAQGGVGWLFALADKQISRAIIAMHDDPSHQWALRELAGQAGLSRSTFAQKFKALVGQTPMEYLTQWRMILAADRLTNSDQALSEIAASVGYESESAFGATFKRWNGRSPRQYARRLNPRFDVAAAMETFSGENPGNLEVVNFLED